VADRCDDLAGDADLVICQGVQCFGDAALDAVFDGDDTAFEVAVGDGFDDRGHRLPEGNIVGDGAGGTV